jgi:hypothetical protein
MVVVKVLSSSFVKPFRWITEERSKLSFLETKEERKRSRETKGVKGRCERRES